MDFLFGLEHIIGKASYEVSLNSLKSALIFPTNTLNTNLQIKQNIFSIKASFSIINFSENGEDFDWNKNYLTTYSSSKNKSTYLYLKANIKKNFFNYSIEYRDIFNQWKNTTQYDFTTNRYIFINENTLTFSQKLLIQKIGLQNRYLFFNYIFAIGKTKDKHLKRGFYTTQNIIANGFDIGIKYIIKNFSFSLKKEFFKDNNTKMKYYSSYYNVKLFELDSNYKFSSTSFSIDYKINF